MFMPNWPVKILHGVNFPFLDYAQGAQAALKSTTHAALGTDRIPLLARLTAFGKQCATPAARAQKLNGVLHPGIESLQGS